MKLTYGLLLLVLCAPVVAQPTKTQCRARVVHQPIPEVDFKAMQFHQLTYVDSFMGSCTKVDPEWQAIYWVNRDRAIGEQADRMGQFISRRNLMNQFLDEDKAGQR
jgi:hypothetical protein